MQDLSAEDLGLPFDPEVVNDWIQNVAESSPLLGDPQGTAAARDLVTEKNILNENRIISLGLFEWGVGGGGSCYL